MYEATYFNGLQERQMKSIKEIYRIGRGPSSSHTMGPESAAKMFIGEFPSADRYEAVLYGMDTDQIEYAAEVAMEHHLGLTCDPVMGLVQVPCIERNAVAAMRAINAVSLANFLTYTRKISFDLIVETMYQTGKDLSKIYRETSEGGLAKLYKPAQKNESTEEIK